MPQVMLENVRKPACDSIKTTTRTHLFGTRNCCYILQCQKTSLAELFGVQGKKNLNFQDVFQRKEKSNLKILLTIVITFISYLSPALHHNQDEQ